MSDKEICSQCGREIKIYPASYEVYDDEGTSYLGDSWCCKCFCKFMDNKYHRITNPEEEIIRIYWPSGKETTNEDQSIDGRRKRNIRKGYYKR